MTIEPSRTYTKGLGVVTVDRAVGHSGCELYGDHRDLLPGSWCDVLREQLSHPGSLGPQGTRRQEQECKYFFHRGSLFLRRPAGFGLVEFVLLFEPMVEGLEVFEHGAGVEVVGAGHLFEGDLGWLGLAGGEHGVKLVAGGLRSVEGAAIEGALVAGGLAHGFVELELVDAGEEVTGVGDVSGDVVFGAGIEVGFGAGGGWGDALVFFTERPPGLVVVAGLGLAGEDLPAPLVDEQAEGEEGDLVHGGAELEGGCRLRGAGPG